MNNYLKMASGIFVSLLFTGCSYESSAQSSNSEPKNSRTNITEGYDEIGRPIKIVKSKRDEGINVLPSTQSKTIKDVYYCDGHQVETILAKRIESREIRSITLDIKFDNKKINFEEWGWNTPNLFGYENVTSGFACADDIIRVLFYGQAINEQDTLMAESLIVDFLIERKTGELRKLP